LTPIDPSVKKSTLDLTPYRLQKLKPVKGHHYRYQVWDLSTGELTQKGMISPDQWGFLTIEQLKVAAGGNRVVIEF
jgi:hypothetical protein